MLRPLNSIPLPSSAVSKLHAYGYYYLEDLVTPKGVSPDAHDLLKSWSLDLKTSWTSLIKAPVTRSALDIWQEEISHNSIATFSKAIDRLLGGGIHPFVLSEFCGLPGSGKTQICLQLCVNVQLPKEIGGLEGDALFIDTCSSFFTSRLRDIAEACEMHCLELKKKYPQSSNKLSKVTSRDLLNGVKVLSLYGNIQLLAAIFSLRSFLQQNLRVRLIIVDSLSFPFLGTTNTDYLERLALLYRILNELQKLAHEFQLAVVVTNQLTTRIKITENEREAELVPALGETFAHRVNQRILLGDLANCRTATLIKGQINPETTTVPFLITESGIRDCQTLIQKKEGCNNYKDVIYKCQQEV